MNRFVERCREQWSALRADAARLVRWTRLSGPFYGGSALVHIVIVLALLAWNMPKATTASRDLPDEIDTEIKEPEVVHYIIGTPPVRLSELTAETLAQSKPPSQEAKKFDETPVFEDAGGGTVQASNEPLLGGLGGFTGTELSSTGSKQTPERGVGIGLGTSQRAGTGGAADGFGGSGIGSRPKIEGPEETVESERAVAAALNWLRRHQHEDGRWSLTGFASHCREATCQGACDKQDDLLATALGVLPFLASGQTHQSSGPYQHSLARAIEWLLARQSPDGSFVGNSSGDLQSHCIATLVLCETFAMTGDRRIGEAAQQAIFALERNPIGDTDGWQWAAFVSASRVGLSVDPNMVDRVDGWLADNTRDDEDNLESAAIVDAKFEPTPVIEPAQLMAVPVSDGPTETDVIECLIDRHNPAERDRNRRRLLATQAREGCLTGSWPNTQATESSTLHAGRFPTTCFAAMVLATSYRKLPMHAHPSQPLARVPEESGRH